MMLREAVAIVQYQLIDTYRRLKILDPNYEGRYDHPLVKMCCDAALNQPDKWLELKSLVLPDKEFRKHVPDRHELRELGV